MVGHGVAGEESAVDGVVLPVPEVIKPALFVKPLPLEKIWVFRYGEGEVCVGGDEAVGVGCGGIIVGAVPALELRDPAVDNVSSLLALTNHSVLPMRSRWNALL